MGNLKAKCENVFDILRNVTIFHCFKFPNRYFDFDVNIWTQWLNIYSILINILSPLQFIAPGIIIQLVLILTQNSHFSSIITKPFVLWSTFAIHLIHSLQFFATLVLLLWLMFYWGVEWIIFKIVINIRSLWMYQVLN